jgi:hypothetical protein
MGRGCTRTNADFGSFFRAHRRSSASDCLFRYWSDGQTNGYYTTKMAAVKGLAPEFSLAWSGLVPAAGMVRLPEELRLNLAGLGNGLLATDFWSGLSGCAPTVRSIRSPNPLSAIRSPAKPDATNLPGLRDLAGFWGKQ